MLSRRPPRSLVYPASILAFCLVVSAHAEALPIVYFPNQFTGVKDVVSRAYEGEFRVSPLPQRSGYISPVEFQSGRLPVVRDEAGSPIEASVDVVFIVGKNGRVSEVRVVNSTSHSADPAVRAYLRQRRYFPASLNGTTLPVVRYETINFPAPQKKGFEVKETFFLNPNDTAQRCTQSELDAYVQRLREVCADYFKNSDEPETLFVIVVILPKVGARVWLKSTRMGELTPERKAFRNQLEAVPPCAVGRGPVIFSFRGEIAGGDGRDVPEVRNGYTPLIPKERRVAWQEEYYFGDSMLEAAWYLEDR